MSSTASWFVIIGLVIECGVFCWVAIKGFLKADLKDPEQLKGALAPWWRRLSSKPNLSEALGGAIVAFGGLLIGIGLIITLLHNVL